MIIKEDLEKFIVDKLSNINDNVELCLVLNSSYVVEEHKTVYAAMSYMPKIKSKGLIFFVKDKENGQKIITAKILTYLTKELNSTTFEGINLPDHLSFALTANMVRVDTDLNLLILETPIYSLGRDTMQYSDTAHIVRFGNLQLEPQLVNQIREKFKEVSYDKYYQLIYSALQRRFIPRLYRVNAFYKILNAFVPVFIQYDKIYDPLLGDKNDIIFKNSGLYKVAVQKGHLIEVSNSLRCYMLTHKEICEALHMHHFMRFPPDFLYKFIISLGNYNLKGFPNKNNRIFLAPVGEERDKQLKRNYTENEYNQELAKYANLTTKAREGGDDEKAKFYEQMFITLQSYRESNSLRYFCESNYQKLTSFGSLDIDPHVTVDQLFEYLNEATL